MIYEYNTNYFDGKILKQLRPKINAIKTYILSDGIILAMFQGKRGERPDLDFKIKILRPGKLQKPEPPPHVYWVVDLLLKIEKYKKEVRDIVDYYIKFYDNCKPFDTVEERNKYELVTVKYIVGKFKFIEQANTLSLDYVASILELFSLCEKRNTGAYMFRGILTTFLDYIDGKADYMHLLGSSKAGY